MLKTITTSDLREQVKRVLNEVGYGGVQYLVERNGEPTAAIVSLDDYKLLEAAKRQQARQSLQDTLARLRQRGEGLETSELEALIREARAEYNRTSPSAADDH